MGHTDAQSDGAAAAARKRALEQAIDARRRAVLVVNTQSRRGRELFEDAQQALVARGIVLDEAFAVRDAARLPEIVREAEQ